MSILSLCVLFLIFVEPSFRVVIIEFPYLPVNDIYNQNSCSSLDCMELYKINFLSNLNNCIQLVSNPIVNDNPHVPQYIVV